MALFSSIKKAFGFPDEYDEADEITPGAFNAENTSETAVDTAPAPEPVDTDALMGQIFDEVIRLFNAIQPEFVRQSLDTDKQRRYIMQHIDLSLRTSLDAIAEEARHRGELKWEAEKKRLTSDIESIRSEYEALCRQREELKTAELSATRQKRALNERIHDLESKVETLEAEKEQYMLESRSMANKLRVANVRAASSDPESDEVFAKLITENETLNIELKRLNQSLDSANETINSLKIEIEQLQAQTEEEHIDPAMIEQIEAQIKQFEEVKRKKDSRIAELKESVRQSQEQIEAANQLVAERDTEIAALQNKAQALSKTIEENLYVHANVEAELREEIKRLNATHPNKNNSEAAKRKKRDKRHFDETVTEETVTSTIANDSDAVKISAIDELMDNTDWFVAPDPTPLKKSAEVEEEFGYREPSPAKKMPRDDDKQLSLW